MPSSRAISRLIEPTQCAIACTSRAPVASRMKRDRGRPVDAGDVVDGEGGDRAAGIGAGPVVEQPHVVTARAERFHQVLLHRVGGEGRCPHREARRQHHRPARAAGIAGELDPEAVADVHAVRHRRRRVQCAPLQQGKVERGEVVQVRHQPAVGAEQRGAEEAAELGEVGGVDGVARRRHLLLQRAQQVGGRLEPDRGGLPQEILEVQREDALRDDGVGGAFHVVHANEQRGGVGPG